VLDTCLVWPLVKPGGIVAFDDWTHPRFKTFPRLVAALLAEVPHEVLVENEQLWVSKSANGSPTTVSKIFSDFLRTFAGRRASNLERRWRSSLSINGYKDEPTSQVLRIMMLSRLMPDCDQSGTGGCAISARLLAAQPARPQFRHKTAGNSGSTGLRCEESPYPLRT
jgi:hypothetical protein